jgi:hypothetical protein
MDARPDRTRVNAISPAGRAADLISHEKLSGGATLRAGSPTSLFALTLAIRTRLELAPLLNPSSRMSRRHQKGSSV